METSLGQVYFNEDWNKLNKLIEVKSYTKLFLIADSNTLEACFPIFITELDYPVELIEVEPGEGSKDLEICAGIWRELSEKEADRKSLIIALGGGVVTDLSGFIASVYKRGIDYITLPTSLLAMVDAAVGGKTGIDFLSFKNQLGSFYPSHAVFIHTPFLKTLPKEELLSGFAELVKHALISNRTLFEKLESYSKNSLELIEIIQTLEEAISIKVDLVKKDPFDKKERKLLNFGHSIGHAIESYFLAENRPIPHGYAVAAGMVIEARISAKLQILDWHEYERVTDYLGNLFPKIEIPNNKINTLTSLLSQDKKREGSNLQLTLLSQIGKGIINQNPPNELIEEALLFYINN